MQQEVEARLVPPIQTEVKKCDVGICVCLYALVKHIVRVQSLGPQLQHDLVS